MQDYSMQIMWLKHTTMLIHELTRNEREQSITQIDAFEAIFTQKSLHDRAIPRICTSEALGYAVVW